MDGNSILMDIINLADNPGRLVSSIIKLRRDMMNPNGLSSVNWSNWLSGSFTSLDSRRMKSHAKAKVNLKRLQSLINQSTDLEPALTDVIMSCQIYDCCNKLGLNTISK